MNRWIMPGFGGALAVVALTALWQAGGAPQPGPGPGSASSATADETWGTPDGGVVSVKVSGTFSILCDDVTDKSSVFSEGRVVGRTGAPDGERTYRLKPTTPGQEGWVFELIAKADGTGELYVTRAGRRHLVAPLHH